MGASSAQLRAAFQRDGFAVLRSALDPPAVASLLAHLGRLRSSLRLAPEAAIVAGPGDADLEALAADGRVRGPAAALLGAEVEPFGISYLCKVPDVGLAASWHQDGEPWTTRLAGAAALTAWVALTPADPANGCLLAIPGSHGLAAQPLVPDDEPSLFGGHLDPVLFDERRAVALPVAAGDVVFHHPNLVHASGANRTGSWRIALAIRYRALDS